jgi:hypothetical protein
MNVLLWVLQILLALHTTSGALWKLSRSAQTVPSLAAIPPAAWHTMSVVELVAAVCLVLPAFSRRLPVLSTLAPWAAGYIAAEMLLYSGLDLFSGHSDPSHLIYWLVVATISAFIAYGRSARKRPVAPVNMTETLSAAK